MPPFLFAPLEMELRSPKHLQRNLQRVMLSCIQHYSFAKCSNLLSKLIPLSYSIWLEHLQQRYVFQLSKKYNFYFSYYVFNLPPNKFSIFFKYYVILFFFFYHYNLVNTHIFKHLSFRRLIFSNDHIFSKVIFFPTVIFFFNGHISPRIIFSTVIFLRCFFVFFFSLKLHLIERLSQYSSQSFHILA